MSAKCLLVLAAFVSLATGLPIDSSDAVSLPASREQTSAQEDMIQSALQVSRRKVRMFKRLEEQFKTAREDEEKQFERLHIALKGVKSDTAYLKSAEKRLRLAQQKLRDHGIEP